MSKQIDNDCMLEFREEKEGEGQGFKFIAGLDEVGRGCLAGPVVAAAVIIPREKRLFWYRKVNDSKLLTHAEREYLDPLIYDAAITIGIGVVYPEIIDKNGITSAVGQAMKEAVEKLLPQPEYLLIDYLTIPNIGIPQKGIKHGDSSCFSIACASVVAKVFRDRLMTEIDNKYPGYGFAKNKGYGTNEHIINLNKLGPCAIHRRLFRPVAGSFQLSFNELKKR